jgi:hypothetical protein
MRAKLLHEAGRIEEGATVELGARCGENATRGAEDSGGASTTPGPVYAVTDADGHVENVDTRDFKIVL